jgi:hypothetical protein
MSGSSTDCRSVQSHANSHRRLCVARLSRDAWCSTSSVLAHRTLCFTTHTLKGAGCATSPNVLEQAFSSFQPEMKSKCLAVVVREVRQGQRTGGVSQYVCDDGVRVQGRACGVAGVGTRARRRTPYGVCAVHRRTPSCSNIGNCYRPPSHT